MIFTILSILRSHKTAIDHRSWREIFNKVSEVIEDRIVFLRSSLVWNIRAA